jgi:hypothetical protein
MNKYPLEDFLLLVFANGITKKPQKKISALISIPLSLRSAGVITLVSITSRPEHRFGLFLLNICVNSYLGYITHFPILFTTKKDKQEKPLSLDPGSSSGSIKVTKDTLSPKVRQEDTSR